MSRPRLPSSAVVNFTGWVQWLVTIFEKLTTGNPAAGNLSHLMLGRQLSCPAIALAGSRSRTRETVGQNRGMCTQVVYVEAVDVSADYLVIPPGGTGDLRNIMRVSESVLFLGAWN
jgi:hypothetical protein